MIRSRAEWPSPPQLSLHRRSAAARPAQRISFLFRDLLDLQVLTRRDTTDILNPSEILPTTVTGLAALGSSSVLAGVGPKAQRLSLGPVGHVSYLHRLADSIFKIGGDRYLEVDLISPAARGRLERQAVPDIRRRRPLVQLHLQANSPRMVR